MHAQGHAAPSVCAQGPGVGRGQAQLICEDKTQELGESALDQGLLQLKVQV